LHAVKDPAVGGDGDALDVEGHKDLIAGEQLVILSGSTKRAVGGADLRQVHRGGLVRQRTQRREQSNGCPHRQETSPGQKGTENRALLVKRSRLQRPTRVPLMGPWSWAGAYPLAPHVWKHMHFAAIDQMWLVVPATIIAVLSRYPQVRALPSLSRQSGRRWRSRSRPAGSMA